MKRILILADDPTLNTGYARVARFIATTLQNNGYRVRYLPCNAVVEGTDRSQYNFELAAFEAGDRYNGKRFSEMLVEFKPALAMVFGDFAWVGFAGNISRQMGVRSLYYMPVEGKGYPPKTIYITGGFVDLSLTLQKFHHIVAYSKFGAECINKLLPGIVTDTIPHQVDTKMFRPLDRELIFKNFFPSLCEDPGMNNTFIVGYVGRNQRRKGTDYALQGFAEFLKLIPEGTKQKPYLSLTTDPKDPDGYNLLQLIDDLGLRGSVIINAVIGGKEGPADNQLVEIYNTFDVALCPHRAEGFGLPVLEAMACGCTVVTTDYATPPEILKDAGYLIPTDGTDYQPGTNCEWTVVDPHAIAVSLYSAFSEFKLIENYPHVSNDRAVGYAKEYSEDVVAKKWLQLLKDIQLPDLTSTIEDSNLGVSDADAIMNSYIDDVV